MSANVMPQYVAPPMMHAAQAPMYYPAPAAANCCAAAEPIVVVPLPRLSCARCSPAVAVTQLLMLRYGAVATADGALAAVAPRWVSLATAP